MNEIDKLFADVNPIPIINTKKTQNELNAREKEFDSRIMTSEEEAELKKDIRNGNVIFHIQNPTLTIHQNIRKNIQPNLITTKKII